MSAFEDHPPFLFCSYGVGLSMQGREHGPPAGAGVHRNQRL